jgi:hypothetical protein
MKKDSIIKNEINTNADSNLKGFDLQKLRATERLLKALSNNKKCVFCTIEYIDDVIEVDFSNEQSKIQTEQNKDYTKPFSMNSEELKNSLRIFFDTWRKVEDSESITFVFYTNTGIAKEKRIGVLKDTSNDLPNEPLIQLLIEEKYDEVLPFVIPIVKDYYKEQHKRHSEDNSYYEILIEEMKYEEWKKFFSLIEWRFGQDDEKEIRNKIKALIVQLCKEYDVDIKYSSKILASILDMINSRALENDFLNKLVHVSDIKVLFYDFVRDVKVEEKLDPVYRKWDELKCEDVRDLGEKILAVCDDFDEDSLFEYEDDFVEGKFEQQHCTEIKEVKAYNYRIYKVCKKYIKNLLKSKDKDNLEFSEDDIIKIIEELTNESEQSILDKSKTYKMPYMDRDMVYKTVLILFQECFIALDRVGDLK